MELSHLIELIKELEPNQKFKYVRGDDYCTYLGVEESEPRVNSLTPLNEPHSISGTYLTKLAESIQPYKPFNISQLMNNSGSNRPVIESIIAHTSEFYWIQMDRAKYVVWVPTQKHNVGELVEWKDADALKKMEVSHFLDSLHNHNTPLQKIWFGAPGSGKSYKVKQLTETSNDEGFEGMTTEERQMAYQEYLDKKNAGKSSYRGGKTNFKALSHPKLMKYVAESSGYEINSLFEISREDAFNEITEALDKYEPYLEDSITKGSDCHWKTGLNSYGDFIKEQSKSSSKRKDIVFRATFHPDYDYASFVGCYKPSMNDGKIEYSFTPQVFTKAYIAAWENTSKPVYLVIEEINRGNCAQIFGDIFQLLDRDQSTGMSQYPIQVDKDLSEYIETRLGSGHPGIAGGNLQLPANLHIYATMNTSDQSLFPMDSAFKRRWDWEYVPIDLKCPESQFTITIGDIVYKWPSFLEKVNERIHALSDSEDKQMGNFFIKHDVEVEEFKSKVMFYLWSEVCKEYEKSGSFFKNRRNSDAEFTFNSLFPTNDVTNSILQGFMEYLGVEIVSAPQPSEQTVADSKSNQEAE